MFTAEDWDAIRHTALDDRGELLDQLAIHDHDDLVSALAGHGSLALH